MILYLTATTNCTDLLIDFIEVQLSSGKVVYLNWDESGICRDDNGFNTRYKGVCFGEEYANGRLNELRGMKIQTVKLYSELDIPITFRIDEMIFEDAGEELIFKSPSYETMEVE